MLKTIIGKLTNNNEYKVRELSRLVDQINKLEPEFEKLKDDDIKNKTNAWQQELKGLTNVDELNKRLDQIMPEAFALVREAGKRSVNQRFRDVQILAAIVLHQGKIAEQKTGEGKTLTAIAPLYLNSLTGKGAHLVTPNDYLSKIAPGMYGPLYEALGVSVGIITSQDHSYVFDSSFSDPAIDDKYTTHLRQVSRSEAYKCDITYGTNHEFGFDYLRDNRAKIIERLVQTNPNGDFASHNFAIVDEVDNILIDIARTPLIIADPKELKSDIYYKFANLASELVTKTDYILDEKEKHVTLTSLGINKIERKLGVENLYEKDFETVHHIENALHAKVLLNKDKDYVVKDGEIIIVDQNTGRLLHGNRWSNGLHQAVEAKENVAIKQESKTIATISYQNYFRLYKKLAGMTGTAATEAEEFMKMYSLDVVSVPTYKPVKRIDHPDTIFKTEAAKFRAIARDIADRNTKGQPVLIGTTTVEKSQLLSGFLKKLGVKHEILNAKNDEKEASIIAKAGSRGAVTVSTNMAGRGVDIILGGDFSENSKSHEEVISLGGLYVIGTERHDSRRIDNQLRGRSGRQGDMGESRFYLSLQDDLLRIFGGDAISRVMGAMKIDDNTPIESRMISSAIENAQKKVEGMNFDHRRDTVEYDDVMNIQREAIYNIRRRILLSDIEIKKVDDKEEFINNFFVWANERLMHYANQDFTEYFEKKSKEFNKEVIFYVVKRVILDVIDVLWTDHIDAMDNLKFAVKLRRFGQNDPLVEYKREGKMMFEKLLREVWMTSADRLIQVEIQIEANQEVVEEPTEDLEYTSGKFESGVGEEAKEEVVTQKANANLGIQSLSKNDPYAHVGRNDPCPCGSGKKFKKCHGA